MKVVLPSFTAVQFLHFAVKYINHCGFGKLLSIS